MNGGKPCNKKAQLIHLDGEEGSEQRTAQKGMKKREKLQRMRVGKWENNNDRKK